MQGKKVGKKVLFLKSTVILPITGADISMFERLQMLRKDSGREILALGSIMPHEKDGIIKIIKNLGLDFQISERDIRYKFRDVQLIILIGGNHQISSGSEFILFANFRDLAALDFAVNNPEAKHVIFLTEDEYSRPWQLEKIEGGELIASNIKKIKRLIVASEFLKKSIKHSWNLDAEILTNAVDIPHYSIERAVDAEYITLLHPNTHKGLDIFLQIAKGMPERKFLVAGGVGEDYRKRKAEVSMYKNITQVPFQPDIRNVYRKSRIVLVPSLWQEAFSRVVIESQAAGIPVIASNRGGLKEAGGEAAVYLDVKPLENGISPPQNTESWITEIKKLDLPEEYEKRRNMSLQRAKKFAETLQADIAKFNRTLDEM